jgi:hypothetical protein
MVFALVFENSPGPAERLRPLDAVGAVSTTSPAEKAIFKISCQFLVIFQKALIRRLEQFQFSPGCVFFQRFYLVYGADALTGSAAYTGLSLVFDESKAI